MLDVDGYHESVCQETYNRLSEVLEKSEVFVEYAKIHAKPVLIFEDNGKFDWDTLATQVATLMAELEEVRKETF